MNYGGPEGSRMQIKIMTANKNITANENITQHIKILIKIMTANENIDVQIKILLQIQKKKRNATAILRTSLCKNQTSWEMKVFNPPSNFACS